MSCNISDFLLYLIADADCTRSRPLSHVVEDAVLGGVTAVQYRDKSVARRYGIGTAHELRNITRKHGASFIINDRPDVAVATEADGVHVGQTDMSATTVRKRVGDGMVVGVTVRNPAQIEEAVLAGADYVGFGPVFPTTTKQDAPPAVGIDRLREIVAVASIPVIAIGGITVETAAEVVQSGAGGIAVGAAIMEAENPRATAARFSEVLKANSASGKAEH